MTVLVGYAGRHGPARGIAECLAARLEEGGFPVEVRPLEEVADPGRYGAFVVGSALRGGVWLPDATDFVRRTAGTLAGRPLWLFGVRGSGAGGGRSGAGGTEPLGPGGLMERLRPRGYRLFSGAREGSRLPVAARLTRALGRGRGGGLRDRAEIGAWADGIACELAATAHGH